VINKVDEMMREHFARNLQQATAPGPSDEVSTTTRGGYRAYSQSNEIDSAVMASSA